MKDEFRISKEQAKLMTFEQIAIELKKYDKNYNALVMIPSDIFCHAMTVMRYPDAIMSAKRVDEFWNIKNSQETKWYISEFVHSYRWWNGTKHVEMMCVTIKPTNRKIDDFSPASIGKLD